MIESKIFSLNRSIKWLMFAAMASFSYLCYYYQIQHPVCCDAVYYLQLAEQISSEGLIADPTGVRLYGYPLFIALIIKFAGVSSIEVGPTLYLAQISLYFIATLLITKQVALKFPQSIANICWFALMANFFVYPYLAISLTDGISVILLLFICYVILVILSNPRVIFSSKKNVFLWLALGFLVGLSIMMRPANIAWVLLFIPVVLWQYRLHPSHGRMQSFIGSILITCGFSLAVAPQIFLNWNQFEKLTFMPTWQLGENQIRWGIAHLKYATSMVNGEAGITYSNRTTESEADTILWYFKNPANGIRTVFFHIFSAFDFDYLFPYIYNYKPKYRIALFIFSQFIIFWSTVGYILAIRFTNSNSEVSVHSKSIQSALLLLFALLVSGWVAIHALSAVENRFSLPVVTAMLPLAVWAFFEKLKGLKYRKWLLGSFLGYLVIAWQLSSYVSSRQII